jgi:hypothetical protein
MRGLLLNRLRGLFDYTRLLDLAGSRKMLRKERGRPKRTL